MTNSTQDTEERLAERCEQATGDDMLELINLECDICAALGIETGTHETPFTSSIDAAMKLVPDGATTGVFTNFGDGGCKAFVGIEVCRAATAALALCAAALKAKAQQQ